MIKGIDKDLARLSNLSKKEQSILQALPLSTGVGMGLSELARATGIARTTLPYPIKRLQYRGFMSSRLVGKRTHYFETIAEALARSASSRGGIQPFKGKNDIKSIFDKVKMLYPNERILGIQPDKSLLHAIKTLPLDYLLNLNQTIKSKKLIFEGVVHEKSVKSIIKRFGPKDAKKIFDSFIGRLEDYVKIPDEFADVGAEIYIFKNQAFLINWESEAAVGITDPEIVGLLKAMFECVKAVGIRYSQNQKMKSVSDISK